MKHRFHDPEIQKLAAVAAAVGARMTTYTTTTSLTGVTKTAYDQLLYFSLRPQLYFDGVADVQPTRQSMPGAAVVFTILNTLAVATSPLTQTSDVSAVAISDSQITLTLAEYGNAVITTAKLRGTSFVDITPAVVNILGFNAGVSLDSLARNVLDAGTYHQYSQGTTATVPTARTKIKKKCTIRGVDVRKATATLRVQNVPTVGPGYMGYIHPNVSVDLRQETGAAGWRTPHTYSQPQEIWTGEIGMFEGVRFIETPRAKVFTTGGHTTTSTVTPVYATLFLGRQALAKAHSIVDGNGPFPQARPGPIIDKLRRFVPDGWYWLGQYGVFRQHSLLRNESSSSLTYTEPTIDK
jgi:N4-gp56 family major capsid protein